MTSPYFRPTQWMCQLLRWQGLYPPLAEDSFPSPPSVSSANFRQDYNETWLSEWQWAPPLWNMESSFQKHKENEEQVCLCVAVNVSYCRQLKPTPKTQQDHQFLEKYSIKTSQDPFDLWMDSWLQTKEVEIKRNFTDSYNWRFHGYINLQEWLDTGYQTRWLWNLVSHSVSRPWILPGWIHSQSSSLHMERIMTPNSSRLLCCA